MDNYQQVWNSLKDEEYRQEFSADVDTTLAFQIKLLREKNGWTQEQLAQEAGKKQETISQWENPSYGSYSLNTLKTLAKAFDVGLMVKFVPFSELVQWSVNLTLERLVPRSFDEERNVQPKAAVITTHAVIATAGDVSLTWAGVGARVVPNVHYTWQSARDYLQEHGALTTVQPSEVAASDKSKVAGTENSFALAA